MITFSRIDTQTVMDGLVVRYCLHGDRYDGQINASRNGVGVIGHWPVMTTEECVTFEETMARARVQAAHLAEGRMFYHARPLDEEEIDRILGPIPFYEAR